MKPKGNGLIELVDQKSTDKGFFCMQLVSFINDEEPDVNKRADVWETRFEQAKNHQCAYRDKCHIYARTIAKQGHTPVQLQLNFE